MWLDVKHTLFDGGTFVLTDIPTSMTLRNLKFLSMNSLKKSCWETGIVAMSAKIQYGVGSVMKLQMISPKLVGLE